MGQNLAIRAPSGAERLPDEDQIWTNRFLIRSETSTNKYVTAMNRATGKWACDCPGYKRWRKCKHLTQGFGLSTSQIHGYGSLGTTPKRRNVQ